MKNIHACLLTLLFLLLAGHGYGQVNILSDTIKWVSTRFYDVPADKHIAETCYFITYPKGKIEWIKDNGKAVSTLNILYTEGNWNDIYADGKFTYYFSLDNTTGKIVIVRHEGSLTWLWVQKVFLQDSDIVNEYTISQIEP